MIKAPLMTDAREAPGTGFVHGSSPQQRPRIRSCRCRNRSIDCGYRCVLENERIRKCVVVYPVRIVDVRIDRKGIPFDADGTVFDAERRQDAQPGEKLDITGQRPVENALYQPHGNKTAMFVVDQQGPPDSPDLAVMKGL
jgi:hypothetical protein